MKLIASDCPFDGSKIVFYFFSDDRIDFRDLVRDLAQVLHTRVEMKQIGPRDETKLVGGIGPCGRELCCSSFLREFKPVSVKMAKEQGLSLNPSKLAGMCGRLEVLPARRVRHLSRARSHLPRSVPRWSR
jgi:cell fate regulator YaaT (PSP1 superfamily)